ESLVSGVELVQFGDGGLNQSRQRNGLVHPHRNVADAEFQRVEEWMGTNVPPDFFCVVDAIGLDQHFDEILVLAPTGEIVGDVVTGELVKDLAAIRFQSRVHSQPERGIGRKRQDVGQKITGVVHQLDRSLAVLHADVDMQTEYQVSPRYK